MRCLRCKGTELMRSGREPHRLICNGCGQNFLVVMQLVPVSADDRPLMLEEANVADRGTGAG